MANRENAGIENAQEIRGLANRLKPDRPEESPGALAGGTGADIDLQNQTQFDDTPKRRGSAISKYASKAHKKAAKLLGYALVLGDFDGWEAASAIWQARLSAAERAALAWAALRSLDEDDAREVTATVIQDAGSPLPPFFSPMDEAAFWADIASPAELDAYALACVRNMAPDRRAAFLDYVQGRQAA